MKIKKKQINHKRGTTPTSDLPESAVLPFIEHAHELRRRLYYIIASVTIWGSAIYAVQQQVVKALILPARGEHFIYTAVGGGIDFLFRICIYGGIVLSLPTIVYNSLRFIEPLLSYGSRRFILIGSIYSGLLAGAGMVFGYFIGLPAALHFLLHQFTTVQIQPLVTIQSYLHFVIVYMVGSAMLFQLPLFLVLINRIKPLKPKRLLHYERWVILSAFVLAGLMNPTPNIISQLMIAGPFILMYQVGIGMIALINRPKRVTSNEILLNEQAAATPAESRPTPTVLTSVFNQIDRRAMVSDRVPLRINQKMQQSPDILKSRDNNDKQHQQISTLERISLQPRPKQRFMDIIPT